MTVYLSASLRKRLEEIDGHHCAYCKTAQINTGQPVVVDHIIPTTQGGQTIFENLCLTCRRCNEFKGATIKAIDPLTGQLTSLFNPRQDNWSEHFSWDATGSQLLGLTVTRRATVVTLNMNNAVIVDARRRWVSVGWHPQNCNVIEGGL